jgi:hypothetical protein
MPKGLIVKVDGTIGRANIGTLEQMKAAIGGGYVEAVPFGDTGATLLVDEEGKLKGLPFNRKASELCTKYEVGFADDDCIVGDMALIGNADSEGDMTDLPPELAEELLRQSE